MHFALIQKVDRCWHSADVRKLYGMLDKALFEINKNKEDGKAEKSICIGAWHRVL